MKHLVCRIATITVGTVAPYHMGMVFGRCAILSNSTHPYSTLIMFLLIFESTLTIYRPIN